MNKKYLLFLIFLSFLLLFSCASRNYISNNYYILEYFERTEKKDLIQDQPILSNVLIHDATLNKPYNRDNIVIRYFGPKINYSQNEFWGINKKEIIPDLLTRRLREYNIFRTVERNFTRTRPEYEIFVNIENIEKFKSGNVTEAHLNLEFILKKKNGKELITYTVNKEASLVSEATDIFVQKINELILEATNDFSQKILAKYKDDFKFQEKQKIQTQPIEKDSLISEGRKGQLLLPLLTETEADIPYKIIDSTGRELDINAQMGEPITLPVGKYKIKFGSGREKQKMTKMVEVNPYYKTVVQPDWSVLLVDVMDVHRNYRQIRYEIFDAKSGESYGTHLPAKKELGEQQKVWILEPGLYKITIKNEPFNTYRNFTTEYLRKGKVNHISLIVELDKNNNPKNLTGAGVLRKYTQKEREDNWQSSNALHANFNLNFQNDNSTDSPKQYLQINSQIENYLIYNKMPFYYRLRHLSELGTSKSNDKDFTKNIDNFDIKNTFIYFITEKLGVYSRLDANSHFLKGYYSQEFPFTYHKNEYSRGQRVLTIPYLFPLKMKEGTGFNYRILNNPRFYLNLRVGLGLRQEFMHNVYELKNSSKADTLRFTERESINSEGTELSIIGDFNLPWNLTYRSNLDLLFPFEERSNPNLEWENDINLRLFKYLSVYYRLNVISSASNFSELSYSHNLFLRLSYFFH